MARKKSGGLEDLVAIMAKFPWWVGVVLGVISYFVLHHFATSEANAPITLAHAGDAAVTTLIKTLAMFGQYIIALACFIGAGISFYQQHKRQALITNVTASTSATALNDMSWQEFEILVGEAFRLDGYSVKETSSGADGGIDLVLRKEGEQFFVQCKQWKAFKVGVTIVRELYGVMAAEGAAGGFVVTSGVYTQEAKAFAEGRNIKLIDGAKLTELIKKVQKNRHAMTPKEPAALKSIVALTAHQSCPKCGADMVKRIAKQGANAGQTFWGCSTYPKCKGVMPISVA